MPFTVAISDHRTAFSRNPLLWVLMALFFSLWAWTFLNTTDLANWWLENALTILFIIFLLVSYRYYQFSDLSYLLIFAYLSLHVYGATHTYAENPFGYWLKDQLALERNPYDRLVHFSFGFLLAYPMREAFLNWLDFPRWVAWALPIEITLSVSAIYELIEWAVADIFFKEQGAAYLGTQGDVWDAQKDIALAVLGAILATTIVSTVKKVFNLTEKTIND
jgi:putative membrane protein